MIPVPVHTRAHQGFSIGSTMKLNPKSLNQLIQAFSSWETATPDPLDGRAAVKYMTLPETGPVAIKSYQRGGLIAKITKDRYLRMGKPRSQKEFEFLCHASRAGLSVPRPLIYVTRGFFFYKAWLITRRIRGHRPFTQVAMEDPIRGAQLMPSISKQVKMLIKNRIFHVDLHPGNILIDEAGKPYIIDFDKARFTRFSPGKTIQLFNDRWIKAISKYHLPPEISILDLN